MLIVILHDVILTFILILTTILSAVLGVIIAFLGFLVFWLILQEIARVLNKNLKEDDNENNP